VANGTVAQAIVPRLSLCAPLLNVQQFSSIPPALAVIHAGENIIPAGGAGGITVNVTIQGDVTGDEVIRKVQQGLSRELCGPARYSTALSGSSPPACMPS
jgi:hypothetical protein